MLSMNLTNSPYPTTSPSNCEEELLTMMSERIRAMAYRFSQMNPMHDVDDYVNGALEYILQSIRKGHTEPGYLFGVARNIMREMTHVQCTISLDAMLYDEETGMQHELADTYQENRFSPKTQRHQVFTLLAHLNKEQKAVVMSYYRIAPKNGRTPPSKEWVLRNYQMSKERYNNLRFCSVLKMFRCSC